MKRRTGPFSIGTFFLAFVLLGSITLAASLSLQNLYLPIIFKDISLPPTPKPTPPVFPNGDFEEGPVHWTQYSKNEWPMIVQVFPVGVYAYDGAWAAWLGGDNDEIAFIQQQVVIPSDLPFLSFWYWIDSSDSCGFDFAYIFVNDIMFKKYDLCEGLNTHAWVQEVIDLSAYAGSGLSIQVFVECDGTWVSDLFLDQFAFQSNPITGNYPTTDSIVTNSGSLKFNKLENH